MSDNLQEGLVSGGEVFGVRYVREGAGTQPDDDSHAFEAEGPREEECPGGQAQGERVRRTKVDST